MFNSMLFSIGIIFILFIVYFLCKDKLFELLEGFEYPGKATLEVRQSSYSPPKNVMPSGPNPPSQEAPLNEIVVHADPAAKDPYAENQEASNADPKMTYPERSFRPALQNTQVNIAYEGGIAGNPSQNSPDAYQKFGLDTIQNGGEIYNGVFANDVSDNTNFSAF